MADIHSKRAARARHATFHVTCACGRDVYGNGRVIHFRACDAYLRKYGWPLTDGMAGVIRDEHPGNPGLVEAAEKLLGVWFADRRAAGNKDPLRWSEFRPLVWRCVEQALAARDSDPG